VSADPTRQLAGEPPEPDPENCGRALWLNHFRYLGPFIEEASSRLRENGLAPTGEWADYEASYG
jgi:hypothetical protein